MIRETPETETAAKQIEKIKSNPWQIANMNVDPAVWQDASLKKAVIRELLSFIKQNFDEAVFLYLTFRQKKCPWPELDVISKMIHENVLDRNIASFLASAARDQIKGPWPEAEEFLAVYPHIAVLYSKQVLKDRFIRAEKTIMKDPIQALVYARDVIKGPWPEAEDTIMNNPEQAFYYARDVLKKPWPKAEPVIKKDPYWAESYKEWLANSQISESVPGHHGLHILQEFQRDIYHGIITLKSAGYNIEDFPKGTEIIERNKKNIIRGLLKLVEQNEIKIVQVRLALLQKHADVKWPELDIIKTGVGYS